MAGQGYEKGQTQTFYDEFFAVFGVPRKQVAVYEQRVKTLWYRQQFKQPYTVQS